jgi:hypothetical protein
MRSFAATVRNDGLSATGLLPSWAAEPVWKRVAVMPWPENVFSYS